MLRVFKGEMNVRAESRKDAESAVNTMQMPPINKALTALVCIEAAFERRHRASVSSLCVQLGGMWSTVRLSAALTASCGKGSRTPVLTGKSLAETSGGGAENLENVGEEGGRRMSERDERSVSRQSNNELSSPTVSSLVYGYRPMTPPRRLPGPWWAGNNGGGGVRTGGFPTLDSQH